MISRFGGGTTIVLAGAGQGGLDALAAREIPASLEGHDVVVRVPVNGDVRRTLAKVASLDLPMKGIYTRRDTLEDVFLRVVGARLQEGVLAA